MVGHAGRGEDAVEQPLRRRHARVEAVPQREHALRLGEPSRAQQRVDQHLVEQVTLGAPFDWLVMSRRISDYSAGELSALVDTLTGDGTLTAIEP